MNDGMNDPMHGNVTICIKLILNGQKAKQKKL